MVQGMVIMVSLCQQLKRRVALDLLVVMVSLLAAVVVGVCMVMRILTLGWQRHNSW